MSKPYYETEEYSEAENELDTYDDKVKLVMEYRVSEKHKDQQIAELKKQLAEHNEFFNAFNCKNLNEFKDFISTFMLTPHEEQTLIRELKQQLAEKEKEIVGKIRSKCCVEDKCKDGSFVLGINEKDLDTILKEYGGKDESK